MRWWPWEPRSPLASYSIPWSSLPLTKDPTNTSAQRMGLTAPWMGRKPARICEKLSSGLWKLWEQSVRAFHHFFFFFWSNPKSRQWWVNTQGFHSTGLHVVPWVYLPRRQFPEESATSKMQGFLSAYCASAGDKVTKKSRPLFSRSF